MQFDIPEEIKKILAVFQKNHYEIYVVGGAVRDLLTGKPVTDWDFTTNATPEEIIKLFPQAFYDNVFGTVGIPPQNPELKPHEITTFRREFDYSDARRPGRVEWGKSLEEDLSRRDFTINAMALKQEDPLIIIDPYGGQKDLGKKVIRAVGDPNERFREDALRMMRAIRIAAQLGFTVENKTQAAIKQNAPLINRIAKERIKTELFKILASPHADQGILSLRETNLLVEIMPELEKTFGVDQKSPQRHHIYDVGTHSLMSLKYCPATDPVTRFATLIHDIGKPQTYKKLDNGVVTFYNHEVVSAAIAKRIAERLRFSNKEADKLFKLVRWHQFSVTENQTDSAIRRFIKNVGPEYVEDMLALRVGDRLGSGAKETSWRTEEFKQRIITVQKQPFSISDLKINGEDVMKELNIKPGPKVGEVLQKIFDKVVGGNLKNEKAELMKELKTLGN